MQLLLLNTPKVFIHSQSEWPQGLPYVLETHYEPYC